MAKIYLRDGRAPIPEKEHTSKIMSANKAINTKPEIFLRKALWNQGLRGYRLHLKAIPGRPDIVFPQKRIAIFVNGCFWHRCHKCNPNTPKSNIQFWETKFANNKTRDQQKVKQLEGLKWRVIVVWECEIKTDLRPIVEMVKNIVLKT